MIPINFFLLHLLVNEHGYEWWRDPGCRHPLLHSPRGTTYAVFLGSPDAQGRTLYAERYQLQARTRDAV